MKTIYYADGNEARGGIDTKCSLRNGITMF